jgi:hypothetical protein
MSYNHPVPFYQTTTGEVASFSTRFNFAIGFPGKYPGDGMTFFLSSYPSMLPLKSGGGNLGLHNGDGMNADAKDRIIAVEFDTYENGFDSSPAHIGIGINTARASVNTTRVNGSINGSMTAIITFNSSTLMLVASLHFDDQPSRASYQVSTQLTNPISDLLPKGGGGGVFSSHRCKRRASSDYVMVLQLNTSSERYTIYLYKPAYSC